MRVAPFVVALPLLGLMAACKMSPGESVPSNGKSMPSQASQTNQATEPTVAAAHAAPAEVKAEMLKLGEPVTAQVVSLSDIAKQPGAFKGKTIATTGKVAAVCQEKGCWMELVDADGHANVRMHGHAFFVPRSSSGKSAKVQGTVVLMKDGKECEEMGATGAKLELDATGVELL